ncbi:hypothetical protein DEU56DRAFT_731739, partial [Suillus clintonianus]|uniref:uncharacterized protein n=1 Tax=Suillus clintonianus TaxID=1904413 RepID=UPI001B871956
FMNRLAEIAPDPEMLMFGDEAAKNKLTLARQMGCSARETCCVQSRCFVRGTWRSILPILTLDGIITHDTMHGPVTSKRFIGIYENASEISARSYNISSVLISIMS